MVRHPAGLIPAPALGPLLGALLVGCSLPTVGPTDTDVAAWEPLGATPRFPAGRPQARPDGVLVPIEDHRSRLQLYWLDPADAHKAVDRASVIELVPPGLGVEGAHLLSAEPDQFALLSISPAVRNGPEPRSAALFRGHRDGSFTRTPLALDATPWRIHDAAWLAPGLLALLWSEGPDAPPWLELYPLTAEAGARTRRPLPPMPLFELEAQQLVIEEAGVWLATPEGARGLAPDGRHLDGAAPTVPLHPALATAGGGLLGLGACPDDPTRRCLLHQPPAGTVQFRLLPAAFGLRRILPDPRGGSAIVLGSISSQLLWRVEDDLQTPHEQPLLGALYQAPATRAGRLPEHIWFAFSDDGSVLLESVARRDQELRPRPSAAAALTQLRSPAPE